MSLKSLERRFGRFALEDLTFYWVGGQALMLALSLVRPDFVALIQLIPPLVLQGEWWRVASFMFSPPFGNPILAIFALYFAFFMGRSLEAQWGAFRYNLFVLVGFLATVVTAFAFQLPFAGNWYLTTSVFLAFAYLFPDYTILLFFVLPVRVKWIALLTWLFYAYTCVTGGWTDRLLILAAVSNFLLFFGRDIFFKARYGHRKLARHSKAIAERDQPRHVCTVCGVTDKSDRTMEFRYCTKCEPPVAYCSVHLGTHEHRRSGEAT